MEDDIPGDRATIVIHPGSTSLHIGLSTDPTPHTIPHLIAYKMKATHQEVGVASEPEEGKKEKGVYFDESLVLQHRNEITVREYTLILLSG